MGDENDRRKTRGPGLLATLLPLPGGYPVNSQPGLSYYTI